MSLDTINESVEERRPPSFVRSLIDARDNVVQKQRIAFGNRLSALADDADDVSPEHEEMIRRYYARFMDLEEELNRDVAKVVKGSDVAQVLMECRGVGPIAAATFVALVDIERSPTASAFIRYCGYGVADGKAERPVKGQRLSYNKRLKTAVYTLADSFMRSQNEYTAIYYRSREYYDEARPDWTKGHKHMASRRRMMKRWLAHTWYVWRTLEGLPTRSPYVEEYLGHTKIDWPWDYGWAEDLRHTQPTNGRSNGHK